MKNIQIIFSILLMGLFVSCQHDMLELGEMPSVEELEYDISQNPQDPNMVILESFTPNVIPFWSHPMGRSVRQKDTVKLAFPGTYKFVYGVQSGGGLVTADTVVLEITTTNLSYVEDPLWDNLTGGVGESKTWLLDIDAEGVSKYFDGPMYFYGTDNGWQGECLVEGGDCWNWSPDWEGNQWIAAAGDYGQMTFSLEGNAQLTVNHEMLPARGTETGTYFLDADNHVLTTTDATPLHSAENEDCAESWNSAVVFSLTEDYMQLGFLRKESCDGAALLVFNYISQEYAENWVPEDQPDPEPELPEGWYEDVTTVVDSELEWTLSPETPFNWTALDGTFLNDWTSVDSYPDWSGFDASVPATYANFSLIMDSEDNTVEYTAPDGTVSTGTYTLDEKGIYTFMGINPSFSIGTAINLHTTAENQWRILQIEKDPSGAVEGMWVGARDPEKPEYIAYHLILKQGNVDPLKPWKDALVGKTFVPDVNWFVDWVGIGPGFSGGWTNAETFGDDFTTNSWIWTEEVRDIAETASLYFFMEGDQMKVTVSQTLVTEHQDGDNWVTDAVNEDYSVTGNVNIDPTARTLTIDVPLVDYAGSAARWLAENGNDGQWFFVPHGGATLSNIDEAGLWLGYSSSDTETTIYHYIVAD